MTRISAYSAKGPKQLAHVLLALEPFKDGIQGVVVESTYNCYWLVDGLQENGYHVHLANPSAIKQYEGLKHTDDKWDSFWLAQMRRLGILPEGYIYPKEHRAVRDLLRRRLLFVRHRIANRLSLQSMTTRNLGFKMSGNAIKKLKESNTQQLFDCSNLVLMAKNNIAAGDYSSYCRCVKSERISNGKKKGENNKKNGNKYLAWAYVAAANFLIRHNVAAQSFYQHKKATRNGIVAIKALSNKICSGAYDIMRDQVPFDEGMLFK
ncbi:IS110 family transposase [Thermodesulfobacteriota bacterium]